MTTRKQRPRLSSYDRCRDQVIRWLEGCLEVPGTFAMSPVNAAKILALLSRVPDDQRANPYGGFIGKRVKIFNSNNPGTGWHSGTLRAVTPDAWVLDGKIVGREPANYVEVLK